jgi:tetratricopeptide (TPR) repeat protein
MVLRLFGIGPAKSLLAAGTMSGRERLLVVDFDAGKDSSLSHVLTEAVRTNLGQSSVVSIMPPTAVAGALQRMQRQPATHVDLPLAKDIAQREEGDVAGSRRRRQRVRRVAAACVGGSGSDLAAFQKTVDGPAAARRDRWAHRKPRADGESLKARNAPALDQVTTASFDALRKYADANRAIDLRGDYANAATLLREAVAKDTNFAMAYRKLGVTLSNLGMPRAQSDSALNRAYQLRERLPDKEKYLTVATYYQVGPRRDRQKAMTAFEQVRLWIDRHDCGHQSGGFPAARRECARGIALYRVGAVDQSIASTMTALISALFNNGAVPAAESVYRGIEAVSNSPIAQSMPPYFCTSATARFSRGVLAGAT